jgi:hypothetical protein
MRGGTAALENGTWPLTSTPQHLPQVIKELADERPKIGCPSVETATAGYRRADVDARFAHFYAQPFFKSRISMRHGCTRVEEALWNNNTFRQLRVSVEQPRRCNVVRYLPDLRH